MNSTDVLIILCIIGVVARGIELGLVQQLFSTSGFIGGLFIGGFIQHYFVQNVANADSRALLSFLIVIGVGFLGLFMGELAGATVKLRLRAIDSWWLSRADKVGGSVIAGLTLVAFVWLISGLASGVPNQAVQSQVKGSFIVQHVNELLPDAPKTLQRIGKLINPNGFPRVFVGQEPLVDTTRPLPDIGNLQAGVVAARSSVVKISGRSCGSIVAGSGFVAGSNMVITNAHVVAGVRQAYVTDGVGTHAVRAVWFDPDLDIAVLASSTLTAKPLPLASGIASNGTVGAALGFPGGGDFTASPATVLSSFDAVGRNIYEEGNTQRSIYSLRAAVNPGDSGGPLITADGQVIGVIFAKSTTYDQVGYALTMPAVLSDLARAQSGGGQAVSTGDCSNG